jgi:hypothetical protein
MDLGGPTCSEFIGASSGSSTEATDTDPEREDALTWSLGSGVSGVVTETCLRAV